MAVILRIGFIQDSFFDGVYEVHYKGIDIGAGQNLVHV